MTDGTESLRIKHGDALTTPDRAIRHIAPDDTLAVSGFGRVGYPKAIPLELAADSRDLSLTVISGGSVGAEIDTKLVEANAISRRFPYQATKTARNGINAGQIDFHDRHIGGLADEVLFDQLAVPDIALVEAVEIGRDWLVPSTSIGHTPAYVERADKLIVEVNAAQPNELGELHDIYRPDSPPNRGPIPIHSPGDRIGEQKIDFDPSKLVAVVQTDSRDSPYIFRTPNPTDEEIAANFRRFLVREVERNPIFAETIRLQFGVGSLGNALMSELSKFDTGDRSMQYFGEVIQDGLLDLIANDDLTVASATSLALSEDGLDRLFSNVETFTDDIILRPAELSNSPELISRFGMLAVNSALEVDLYGHVNSTHLDGSYLMNGIGGSNDFTRSATVSVIAMPSTASDGDVSRICPMVPHVDHTEHDVDVIITEQGVGDLRGLSPRERAGEIIDQCAHPDYRGPLREYFRRAKDGDGHIPHDLQAAFEWSD